MMKPLHPSRFLPLAAAVSLTACAAGEREPAPLTVRDSAGIEIVENEAPALGQDAWSVSERPILQVGEADGAPEYWFGEIMGMARLSDRRVAVADMGTSQIRFYDDEGRFLRAVGRKGQGPGEFTQIHQLYRLPGEWLLVAEFRPRAHLFDPRGEYVRTVALGDGGGGALRTNLIGVFSDGSYLTSPSIRPMPGVPTPDSTPFLHLDANGTVRDTLGSFRILKWGGGSSDRPNPLVFGPRGHVAASGEHFYYGFSDRYEVSRYTPAGKLERRIRRAWTPEPVSDADVKAYRESYLGMTGEGGRAVPDGMRAQRERNLAETQFAERRPAYARIIADRAGNLWVQEYSTAHQLSQGRFQPTFPVPSRWSVYGPAGRWLTDVTLPASFLVMDIGDDYVLGLARDENDVQQVRMYRLRRTRA